MSRPAAALAADLRRIAALPEHEVPPSKRRRLMVEAAEALEGLTAAADDRLERAAMLSNMDTPWPS